MAKDVKINGVSYKSVPKVSIPLSEETGNADFYDTTDATAAAENILAGKTAYVSGGVISGTMPDNAGAGGTISTKDTTFKIAAGYHNGSGTVSISTAEQAKIISGNIKSGVSILGIAGSATVVETSDATAAAGNIVSGKTAYVSGKKITGTLTLVSVTQDSNTKVLTIA